MSEKDLAVAETKSVQGHTSGPWRVLPEETGVPYIRVRGTRLGERYKVANVLTVGYANAPPREAAETRANARLIAAAPELKEQLATMTALLRIRCGNLEPDVYAEILKSEAVLAKATGGQP